MIVAKTEFPHEDEKKRAEFVKKLLNEQIVTDLVITDMGKKRLAYPIQKLDDGCYILVTFKAEAVSMAKIEEQVKLQPLMLRYLLTRTE